MPKRATNILLTISIVMLTGLLWSRALLSISMGLMLIYTLYYWEKNNIGSPKNITPYFKNPLLIWCSSPILLLFTGIYQEGFTANNLQLLLTFSVYPIAGITAIASEKLDFTITISQPWIHAALIALLYPLGWFVFHSTMVIEQYGTGKSLPVFMDNDHLRFSIFLCSALLFTLLPVNNARYKKISFAILLIAIVFLSVRTSWVLAFIIVLGYGIPFFMKYQSFKKNLPKLIISSTIIIALFWIFPTTQQKIRYSIYDWQQFNSKGYDSTYSDGVRRAMNAVAWIAIKDDHRTAIGWSAIPATMKEKFSAQFNGSKTQYGWPFNQWLFWWMGSGFIGMILFSIWLLYPAWYGFWHKNPFLIIWTFAIAVSCLVESTLNYQYGVLLHVWPMVICWQVQQKNYRSNL
ncbi:MAG: O-antigen ligase family protein [Sphingobacteriia bacterium]